jgi:hypothetical protein
MAPIDEQVARIDRELARLAAEREAVLRQRREEPKPSIGWKMTMFWVLALLGGLAFGSVVGVEADVLLRYWG